MIAYESLTLFSDSNPWTVRRKGDAHAIALADRHYSREVKGGAVGGPGYVFVLVSVCELAVWVSKRHRDDVSIPRVVADGYPPGTYRCALFRNESAFLSSDLIRKAVAMTEEAWGPAQFGWQTYVDRAAVKSTNPGFCYQKAGWVVDRGKERGSKVSLVLPAPMEAAS